MKLAVPVILLLAIAGCTANPYVPESKFAEAREARLVRIAGSRIPQMVDIRDAIPQTRSPVTIITRDRIDNMGASSVSELLGQFSFDYSGAGR